MKAAVCMEPGEIIVRYVAEPVLDADEVLVKVRASGICGEVGTHSSPVSSHVMSRVQPSTGITIRLAPIPNSR